MPVKARIDSIAKDIDLIVSELLSPQAQQQQVAAFASAEIAKADEHNRLILGRVPPRTVTVDGAQGAALTSVRPNGGVIIAEWELVADLLRWIADTLIDRSPRLKGDYIAGHTLFADGVEVPLGSEIPHADEYVFLNLVPYHRKIEIGKTKSGRAFVIQVPNLIYERTGRDAKAKFGNMAQIRYTYRAFDEGAIMRYRPVRSRKDRDYAARERSNRVPAIVVKLRDR